MTYPASFLINPPDVRDLATAFYTANEASTHAANAAWVEGSPAYRASVTAALRRQDATRFTHRLAAYRALEAAAPCDEHRRQVAYYEQALAQAEAEEAAALAVMAGGRELAA